MEVEVLSNNMNDGDIAVVVFGANRYVMSYAPKNNYKIILIEHPDSILEDSIFVSDATILIDYTQPELCAIKLCDALAHYKIIHVFSAKEKALEAAAAVGDKLGLNTTPPHVVKLIMDKFLFRKSLTLHNPECFVKLMSTEDIEELFSDQKGPFIIKPTKGTGSFGVSRVDNPEQALAAYNKLRDKGQTSIMAESYLEGDEVSVESFSFGGEHVVLAITDKKTLDNHIEIGHTTPAQIDLTTHGRLKAATAQVLTEVGIKDGPSHTEFKLSENGPVVLETHNRTGGDMISYLVELVTGVNQFELSFCWQTGLITSASVKSRLLTNPNTLYASVAFRQFEEGVISDVFVDSELNRIPGVKYFNLGMKPGDTISAWQSSFDRTAMTVAIGQNATESQKRCIDSLNRIIVQYEERR